MALLEFDDVSVTYRSHGADVPAVLVAIRARTFHRADRLARDRFDASHPGGLRRVAGERGTLHVPQLTVPVMPGFVPHRRPFVDRPSQVSTARPIGPQP